MRQSQWRHRWIKIGILLFTLQGVNALAESSTSEVKASQSEVLGKDSANRKFRENSEITDAKLKADSGSLSKYSMKLSLSYYGPTLGDLSAKDQPNPDGTIGTYETSLGGAIGVRYRFDSKSSMSVGTGIKAIHPLHGAERFDTQTPYLSYDSTFRLGDVQMRSSPGVSVTTIPNYREVGQVGSLTYDISSVYNIPETRWAVGLDGNLSLFMYDRDYQPRDRKASRGAVQMYPTVKFNYTEKTSLMTSTALSWLSPRYRSNETILLNKTATQRLGLGHAFTRDIYVFPYLTLMPTNMSAETTTFNLSTSLSIL
jgi:hypothetical protein